MFASKALFKRYAECYSVKKAAPLARTLGIAPQTVQAWQRGENPVPPVRLRKVVVEMGVSWDWLLEGLEPKLRHTRTLKPPETFDWEEINARFLSLFTGKTQEEIAEELGIRQVNVSRWKSCVMHVPWDKLRHAVTVYGVTWDWLLEG